MLMALKHFMNPMVMQDVLDIYLKVLKKYRTEQENGRYPVICLDEANILTYWQSSAKRQRDFGSLMQFVLKVFTSYIPNVLHVARNTVASLLSRIGEGCRKRLSK